MLPSAGVERKRTGEHSRNLAVSLLGVILAGGASRRFGSPKPLAKLHGRPLWQIVADRLGSVCAEVVLSTSTGEVASKIPMEAVADRRPGAGPLAGIDAALQRARRTGYEGALVVGVDMPWVPEAALCSLAQAWSANGRASTPATDSPWGFEPLCAVYPVAASEMASVALAEHALEAGTFARSLDPAIVNTGEPPTSFRSVNRPEDLPPPAFSVVGNKNSGKTTLAVSLIAELSRRGRRVMSVKHGHHFRLDTPGTDSWRHRYEGGAERVLLAGPDEFALLGKPPAPASAPLDMMLARHLGSADIVVVEGFRNSPIPKVEVYRFGAQPEPIANPANARSAGVLATVTDRPDLPWDVPIFDPDTPDLAVSLASLLEESLL